MIRWPPSSGRGPILIVVDSAPNLDSGTPGISMRIMTTLPAGGLQQVVAAYRQRVVSAHAHYSAILDGAANVQAPVPDGMEATMRRLAVRHAIIRLEAELLWLDEVQDGASHEG